MQVLVDLLLNKIKVFIDICYIFLHYFVQLFLIYAIQEYNHEKDYSYFK